MSLYPFASPPVTQVPVEVGLSNAKRDLRTDSRAIGSSNGRVGRATVGCELHDALCSSCRVTDAITGSRAVPVFATGAVTPTEETTPAAPASLAQTQREFVLSHFKTC